MQLSKARYIEIDGTRVALLAADDAEARVALKELRHKKKELLHHKRRLRRRRKAIERWEAQEQHTGTTPGMSPLDFVARSLGAVVAAVSGWDPFPAAGLPLSREAVVEDLYWLDEVLLNVNEAILHVEGKLIDS